MNSPVADKICTGEFFCKTEFNDLVLWKARVEKKDRKSGKKTWNCGEKSGRIRVVWKTFRKKG